MVPVFRVCSLPEALPFYRDVLGCVVHKADPPDAPFYAVLSLDGEELHLLQDAAVAEYRHAAIFHVADADVAFATLLARGWQPPDRPESPVHCGPVDQSWGTREFYVDDPSGNGLCFQAPG